MLDLILAVLHHLLMFGLLAVLVAELIILRQGIDKAGVARIAAIDAAYGGLAVLIIVIGFSRAIFAAKGWGYYSHNLFFWAKIGAFALIGALSAFPTIAFMRWRKAPAGPDRGQVRAAQKILQLEVALFALLPIFAAAMARGYGQVS